MDNSIQKVLDAITSWVDRPTESSARHLLGIFPQAQEIIINQIEKKVCVFIKILTLLIVTETQSPRHE